MRDIDPIARISDPSIAGADECYAAVAVRKYSVTATYHCDSLSRSIKTSPSPANPETDSDSPAAQPQQTSRPTLTEPETNSDSLAAPADQQTPDQQ